MEWRWAWESPRFPNLCQRGLAKPVPSMARKLQGAAAFEGGGDVIYEAYQSHADSMWPLRRVTRHVAAALDGDGTGRSLTQRQLAAACEVFNLSEITHRRPAWGIDRVGAGDA